MMADLDDDRSLLLNADDRSDTIGDHILLTRPTKMSGNLFLAKSVKVREVTKQEGRSHILQTEFPDNFAGLMSLSFSYMSYIILYIVGFETTKKWIKHIEYQFKKGDLKFEKAKVHFTM